MSSAVAHGAKTSSTLRTAHYSTTSRASLFFRSSSEAAAGQKNRSSDQILERLVKMPIRTGRLADPCAQEASIIVQPHLAAGKKISDRCHRLPTAVRAGTDREDKIPQGEPGSRLEDLPMSFHIVSVCSESSSCAIPHCEYLIHKSHAVIRSFAL